MKANERTITDPLIRDDIHAFFAGAFNFQRV